MVEIMSEYIPDKPEIELIDISNNILSSVRSYLRGGCNDKELLDAQIDASIGRLKVVKKDLKRKELVRCSCGKGMTVKIIDNKLYCAYCEEEMREREVFK